MFFGAVSVPLRLWQLGSSFALSFTLPVAPPHASQVAFSVVPRFEPRSFATGTVRQPLAIATWVGEKNTSSGPGSTSPSRRRSPVTA